MALRHHLADRIPEGVTPYAIAKKAGIATNTIYRLMNDSSSAISPQVLNALCGALDCQPGDLLTFEPDA